MLGETKKSISGSNSKAKKIRMARAMAFGWFLRFGGGFL